ncbi:unnamed protein product [Porites evermanni]|uniref:Uncharacterized protein n=1 Tax=Porites evermanni TaxID=104178 RepID=A0ABN8NCJ7_9CNID|nr:unnamed protein product [Porites evermanni]
MVDTERFPTRSSFAEAVVQSFADTPAKVVQWCCCLEQHVQSGVHFHMAMKLDKNQRWLPSKRYLLERCGISVHFSATHENYFSAWKYVTKEDRDYIQSDGHPDLTSATAPRTTKASSTKRTTAMEKREKGALSTDNCEELTKNIKSRTELLALAREQKVEGKTDIAEFIVNRGAKVVADVLATTWELENSKDNLERQRKSRIQLLKEVRDGECVQNCSGQWLISAKEVLQGNGVDINYFGHCVHELLQKGRGKYRNLMIVGPANCAKTFLLNPLNVIFNTFSNPASTSFAWVGAEQAECIFLNDFRWSPAVIQWHDFLLMLEGQLVHLPAPKSHYAKDIVFEKDTPIFATGKNPIIFAKNCTIDEKETEMMAVRWRIFRFHAQIPQEKQKQIPPCGKCFAQLILGEKDCTDVV